MYGWMATKVGEVPYYLANGTYIRTTGTQISAQIVAHSQHRHDSST